MLAVILNTSSGQGRAHAFADTITELFEAEGVQSRILEARDPEAIPSLVLKALDDAPDAIVAAGGDGTVSAVAGVIADRSIPLGVLPLGTLNHFARDLEIPMSLDAAVHTLVAGHIAPIDVARMNDRVFLNNSSIGVYPSIVATRERLRVAGYRKWPAFARATIDVLRHEDEVSVQLATGGSRIISRTPFLFVGNNEYLVEGPRLGARARLDGGVLFACYAPPVRTRQLPALLAESLIGIARKRHALESVTAHELWVNTPYGREVRVACDGEVFSMTPPLHYEACPGLLKVLVPAH